MANIHKKFSILILTTLILIFKAPIINAMDYFDQDPFNQEPWNQDFSLSTTPLDFNPNVIWEMPTLADNNSQETYTPTPAPAPTAAPKPFESATEEPWTNLDSFQIETSEYDPLWDTSTDFSGEIAETPAPEEIPSCIQCRVKNLCLGDANDFKEVHRFVAYANNLYEHPKHNAESQSVYTFFYKQFPKKIAAFLRQANVTQKVLDEALKHHLITYNQLRCNIVKALLEAGASPEKVLTRMILKTISTKRYANSVEKLLREKLKQLESKKENITDQN